MKRFKTFLKEGFSKRGFKGTKPDGFKVYVRSEKELKSEINDKLNSNKLNIENIAKLYALYNIAPADNFEVILETKDVNDYREYDREKFVDDWNGRNTFSEYNELKNDIKKNGIKSAGILHLERDGDNVGVILGEGNHRLAIAKELKIKKFPIKFYVR